MCVHNFYHISKVRGQTAHSSCPLMHLWPGSRGRSNTKSQSFRMLSYYMNVYAHLNKAEKHEPTRKLLTISRLHDACAATNRVLQYLPHM